MARFDLSDTEWAVVAQLLPNEPRGVPQVDDRRVVNGIFYIQRSGSPWRDLPERAPDSLHLIDSSIVRAHQHAAGGKNGARIMPSAVLVAD